MENFLGGAFVDTTVALAAGNPGFIVGPIANIMGMLYNVLFNFIYSFVHSGSLGIAIVLFTIVVKLVLFPLSYKQQKSSYKMQKLQPEMDRIKKKYANKTDQESQQRMTFEIQDFQKANGISLFGGCLPLIIQLPILYALFYIFQQAYLYVDVIGQNYGSITDVIMNIPVELRVEVFKPIALAKKMTMDLAIPADVIKLVNSLTVVEWSSVLTGLGTYAGNFTELLAQKNMIEYFLGINLVYNAGIGFPGVIIPLAAGISTWVSTKYMTASTNQQQSGGADPTAGMMKTMNTIMPIMMGVMTISMPAGLGVYWTVSNLFQLAQTWAMNKYFKSKDERESKEA